MDNIPQKEWKLSELSTTHYHQIVTGSNPPNPIELCYTILAGSAACSHLKIHTKGYRVIKSR